MKTFNLNLDRLLTKEMTRKDFLIHVGMLALVITGISGLLKTLSDPDLISKKSKKIVGLSHSRSGFGAGPYGV